MPDLKDLSTDELVRRAKDAIGMHSLGTYKPEYLIPELIRRLEAARRALETIRTYDIQHYIVWVDAERAKGNDFCEADWVVRLAENGLEAS